MKINKKSIFALIAVFAVAVFCFAGCTKDSAGTDNQAESSQTETNKAGNENQTEKAQSSQAPVLGEDVKLNSGEVVKKADIDKEAEQYIPDSLPDEIKNVDDLMKYNDYVETLPDGREKELLLLKMQLFLEQIQ